MALFDLLISWLRFIYGVKELMLQNDALHLIGIYESMKIVVIGCILIFHIYVLENILKLRSGYKSWKHDITCCN